MSLVKIQQRYLVRLVGYLSLCLFIGLGTASLAAQELPEDYFITLVADNFDRPRGMDFDANGRTYVYEHRGLVWLIDSSGNRLTEPFLDIREAVSSWQDHGLLGLCLDNDFQDNGYFYVIYSVDRYWEAYRDSPSYNPDSSIINAATWCRVSRFTADSATGFSTTLPGSERVLLGEDHDNGIPVHLSFHGLGKIKQAQDGTLIISNGDGASNVTDYGNITENNYVEEALELGILRPDQHIGSFRSQYLGSFRGKLLRIDPETGDGLPSNPFYDEADPRSPASRTWAYGFRNPYRFTIVPNSGSHDPTSGDPGLIYVGDVGNGAWEELNVCDRPGMNFGWPHYEGPVGNWAFWNCPEVPNRMAPNPLTANNSGCDEYLPFQRTFLRLGLATNDQLPNPCDPAQLYAYVGNPVITPPALTWNNANWNLPDRCGTVQIIPGEGCAFLPFDAGPTALSGPAFGGFSSMAGFIVEGEQWPEAIRGKLLFYDYSGWARLAELDDDGHPVSVSNFMTGIPDLHTLTVNPYNNRIFLLNNSARLREISFGGNPPPSAKGSMTPNFGGPQLQVQYSALNSSDQNANFEELQFHWDFGDGQEATGAEGTHLYQTTSSQPTTFWPVLTVTDPEGAESTDSLIVSLNNTAPVVEITSFRDGDYYPLDKTNLLMLTANVSDAEHTAEELDYQWESFLHHNTHFHPEESSTDEVGRMLIEPLGCGDEDYFFRIRLTVTDPEGLRTVKEQSIYPDCSLESAVISSLQLTTEAGGTNVEANFTINSNEAGGQWYLQRAANIFDFATLTSGSFLSGQTDLSALDLNPLNGTNYYRVKTITADRKINYGEIVSIQWPRPLPFTISPNPAKRQIRLTVREAIPAQQFTFELYTLLGRQLLTTKWVTEGDEEELDHQLFLPLDLPTATYFFQLKGSEGLRQSGKLVIR